jgi:hypothetical protein
MKAKSDLLTIPGVGPATVRDLHLLEIFSVKDLKGKKPEVLYNLLCGIYGHHIDRCVLYVFRCAVYFAEEEHPDAEKLKWWNWKD